MHRSQLLEISCRSFFVSGVISFGFARWRRLYNFCTLGCRRCWCRRSSCALVNIVFNIGSQHRYPCPPRLVTGMVQPSCTHCISFLIDRNCKPLSSIKLIPIRRGMSSRTTSTFIRSVPLGVGMMMGIFPSEAVVRDANRKRADDIVGRYGTPCSSQYMRACGSPMTEH